MLEEEASKLDTAESFTVKKNRDKNNILETEMTDWMLSSVQKTQIGKTSVGSALLTAGGISQAIKLPASSIVTEFNDSIKRTHASPSKMMPFDQFHEMFSTYSKQHVDPSTTAPPIVLAPIVAQVKSGDAHINASGGTKKLRRRRQTDGAIGFHPQDGNSLGSSVEEDTSGHTNRSRNSLLVPIDAHGANIFEPTNLVKTLAEQDANFDAYLKLAQHQQEAATHPDGTNKMRTKLNASISAPRRIRKMNPLGQNAIQLIDSRGRASKDSKKGFGNIFQVKPVDSGEGGAKGEGDDLSVDSAPGSTGKTKRSTIRISTQVNIMGTDNIMGRLHTLGKQGERKYVFSAVFFSPRYLFLIFNFQFLISPFQMKMNTRIIAAPVCPAVSSKAEVLHTASQAVSLQ